MSKKYTKFRVFLKKHYSFFLFFFDSLILLFKKKNMKFDDDLIVFCKLDAIGDFVLWLDSAKKFRNFFKKKKIILIANKQWFELAINVDYWDCVYALDTELFKNNIFYRVKKLIELSQINAKTVIHPTLSRDFLISDSIVRAIGSQVKIGYCGDYSNSSIKEQYKSNKWYSQLVQRNYECRHELENNVHFFNVVSGNSYTCSLPVIEFNKEIYFYPNFKRYCIIFPGSSWPSRRWPSEKFKRIIKYLQYNFDINVILCGSKKEFELCQKIKGSFGNSVVNLAGKTSLCELVSLIENCNLLISNDTSAIHIAAATKTPSICVLGGGHFGRFLPYPDSIKSVKPISVYEEMLCFNCNWNCIHNYNHNGAVPCIEKVQENQVLYFINKIME